MNETLSELLVSNSSSITFSQRMAPPTPWERWGVGLAIVTVSATAAPIAMLFVPLLSENIYRRVMSFLVALGIGAISGSVIFIMVPKAYKLVDNGGTDGYLQSSWVLLAAIYGFFIIDRIIQYLLELRKHVKQRKIHIRTLNLLFKNEVPMSGPFKKMSTTVIPTIIEPECDGIVRKDIENLNAEIELSDISNAVARKLSFRRSQPTITASGRCSPSMVIKDKDFIHEVDKDNNSLAPPDDRVSVNVSVLEQHCVTRSQLEIGSVAYMIIFGSSANNFVDGMSNGVAFSESLFRGLSIGLPCIAQQFPQEIGSLAILAESSLGLKRALLLNLIPGFLSYAGFFIGAGVSGSENGANSLVFAMSSGMYLYVFLGTLVPEVRESTNELIKTDLRASLVVSLLQLVGISMGVGFTFTMAKYGEIMQKMLYL